MQQDGFLRPLGYKPGATRNLGVLVQIPSLQCEFDDGKIRLQTAEVTGSTFVHFGMGGGGAGGRCAGNIKYIDRKIDCYLC